MAFTASLICGYGFVFAAVPEYDEALALKGDLKYAEALAKAEVGAAKNDPDCLRLAGEIHHSGMLNPPGVSDAEGSARRAKSYYERAAALGDTESKLQLGLMADDPDERLRLLVPLVSPDRPFVASVVARLYERGSPKRAPSPADAIKYLELAAGYENTTPGEKKTFEETIARLRKVAVKPGVAAIPAPVAAPAVAAVPVPTPARVAPPVRLVFTESDDFAQNLTGNWELRCNRQDWKKEVVSRFRFEQVGRYSATLVLNPDTPQAKSYGMRIEEHYSQADAYTHHIVRMAVGNMTLKSYYLPRTRSFGGDAVVDGVIRGNWSAKRRLDLDYADAGERALKAKDFDGALHYYNEAVRLRDDADNRFGRGRVHYTLRSNAEAANDFRAVLVSRPDDIPARTNLMMSLYYGQEHEAALKECDGLIGRVPALPSDQLAQVRFFRADALWYLDRMEESEREYAAALTADPSLKDRRRAAVTREGAIHMHLKASRGISETMAELHKANAKAVAELREANRLLREGAAPKPEAGAAKKDVSPK